MAPVPIVPKAPMSWLFIISPTPPPNGKILFAKTKANNTDNTTRPTVTYFRFRQIENTRRRNNKFTPATKKKVHIRKEATPKALNIKK